VVVGEFGKEQEATGKGEGREMGQYKKTAKVSSLYCGLRRGKVKEVQRGVSA